MMERAPLTVTNVATAQRTGFMLGRLGVGRDLSVMLWIRNATALGRGPSDEIQFEVRRPRPEQSDAEVWVSLRTEAEQFADVAGRAPEGRWFPLADVERRIFEWSNLFDLDASLDLLTQFLVIVRDHANREAGK